MFYQMSFAKVSLVLHDQGNLFKKLIFGFKNKFLKYSDWIPLLPKFLLVARAVLARVAHGVALVAVATHVNKRWTTFTAALLNNIFHAVIHLEQIHSINHGGINSVSQSL